jgi:beta-glucosidase
VAPAGRLPISFPASLAQLPRPDLDGLKLAREASGTVSYGLASNVPPFDTDYDIEGANVGYKWHKLKGSKPLFPFGFGLTYTSFRFSELKLTGGKTVKGSVRITNVGQRAGVAVPQFYASVPVRGEMVQRLIGWQRLELAPGQSAVAKIRADPRLLAAFDPASKGWRIAAGTITVKVADHAEDEGLSATTRLKAAMLHP